jgi:hypothetical protein
MAKIACSVLILLVLGPASGLAQEVTAEVRTWSGQSYKVSEPTFEVFYTIVPPVTAALGGGGGYAPGTAAAPGAPAVTGGETQLAQPTATIGVGTVGFQAGTSMQAAAGTLLPTGPASKQGRRQQEFLTMFRSGVEFHVPVANLRNLTFLRQPVNRSPLPPYASRTHFRHAAIAVLVDGSKVEADYANLGTAILRGVLPEGTVDIPWDDIESVTFLR